MQWEDVVDAAGAISWIAYLGTAGADGRPHVCAVAPGLHDGTAWFATRRGTRKIRNLMENPHASLHWPVGAAGPGELFMRGTAAVHDSAAERRRLWDAGVLSYDPAGFFGSPDNPDLFFVALTITYASLLGPDFVRRTWRPAESGA